MSLRSHAFPVLGTLLLLASTGGCGRGDEAGRDPTSPPTSSGAPVATAPADATAVTRVVALGRIQPHTKVRVAGPARPSVVIGKLLVDQGDRVSAGQEIASLDSVPTEEAEVEVWRVEVADAERELERARSLLKQGVTSRAMFDAAKSKRDRAVARLDQAKAELERSHVRSPIDGVVLEVFARGGERVPPAGIVEIADTARMLAVAEVPESEIQAVAVGQPATVTSASLAGPLSGKVARLGGKVRQQEVVSADPVASLDARVVEVEVELDDPAAVADRTNLRVEVEIRLAPAPDPAAPPPVP